MSHIKTIINTETLAKLHRLILYIELYERLQDHGKGRNHRIDQRAITVDGELNAALDTALDFYKPKCETLAGGSD